MRFYIPEIGDIIELEEDWAFALHNEQRNDSVISALELYKDSTFARADEQYAKSTHRYGRMDWEWLLILPKHTQLQIDRIYIRKGNQEYSSITFYIVDCPIESLSPNQAAPKLNWQGRYDSRFPKLYKGKKRFWAKLEDVNRIHFK